ncbi:MAG: hypothetical protein KGI75_14425 [Rhizobiaceae bacterium]|nr:hypothetical protein [Rhizobiaceae bacterium]
MKNLASIALAASLTLGTVLASMAPAAAMPLSSPSPSANASGIVLVQEQGSRRSQNWGHGRREYRWHDRDYDRRSWRDGRWDRRRDWGYGRYDSRYYYHRRGGVYFAFPL